MDGHQHGKIEYIKDSCVGSNFTAAGPQQECQG